METYTAFERFANPKGLPLNAHGRGPSARLVVPLLPAASGVYAVTQGHEVVYVGMATNIAERWGRRGYSVIDPRNCYRGGQSTNCHVNHLIGVALSAGGSVWLWVHVSASPRNIEQEVLKAFRPTWNVRDV